MIIQSFYIFNKWYISLSVGLASSVLPYENLSAQRATNEDEVKQLSASKID